MGGWGLWGDRHVAAPEHLYLHNFATFSFVLGHASLIGIRFGWTPGSSALSNQTQPLSCRVTWQLSCGQSITGSNQLAQSAKGKALKSNRGNYIHSENVQQHSHIVLLNQLKSLTLTVKNPSCLLTVTNILAQDYCDVQSGSTVIGGTFYLSKFLEKCMVPSMYI